MSSDPLAVSMFAPPRSKSMFDPPPADDDNQPGFDDLGSENSQGSIRDETAMASFNNDVAAKKRDRSEFHDSSDDEEAMATAGNLPQAVDTAPKRAPAAPAKAASIRVRLAARRHREFAL